MVGDQMMAFSSTAPMSRVSFPIRHTPLSAPALGYKLLVYHLHRFSTTLGPFSSYSFFEIHI
jgi:hypothetical protein